jgi:hypothetical protein
MFRGPSTEPWLRSAFACALLAGLSCRPAATVDGLPADGVMYFAWLPPGVTYARLTVPATPQSFPNPQGSDPNPNYAPALVVAEWGELTAGQSEELSRAEKQGSDGLWFVIDGRLRGRSSARDELMKRMVPIDTPEKALLAVMLDHDTVLWEDAAMNATYPSHARTRASRCLSCGGATVDEVRGGFEVVALDARVTDAAGCHQRITTFRTVFFVATDGTIQNREEKAVFDESPFCIGRRPEGYDDRRSAHSTAAYFARCGRLEAVSVPAFERLRDELRFHGAPTDLIARADEAASDERRHARRMRSFARRAGAPRQRAPRIGPLPLRSLEAMARENAREGCVFETFSAAIALHQAERAKVPAFRRAMREIAVDEVRHAELAWDVHAWATARLGEAGVRQVEDALVEGRARLERTLRREPVRRSQIEAGEPDAFSRLSMFAVLAERAWA